MDGKKLRQILAMEGISQAKFAEFLGCTRQNVSAMLASDSVRLTTIEKLAELIGKSTQELLSGEQRPNRVEELEAEIRKKDAEIASLNARIDKLLAILEKI